MMVDNDLQQLVHHIKLEESYQEISPTEHNILLLLTTESIT
jgi:hypothetical protein